MKDEVVFGQCIINHKELMMLINYKVDYIEFDCFNLMETCDEDREEIWNLRKNVAIHQHCQQFRNHVSNIINLFTRRKFQKFIHVSTDKMETQIVYFQAENDYKIKLRFL
jgi:hypothetical protein